VLTVAVSIAAGATAIASAYPSLGALRVEMSVAFVVLLTVVNLRGVRETGLASHCRPMASSSPLSR